MKTFEDFIKELEAQDVDKPDCEACRIDASNGQVKQMPAHTCGKDGPVPDLNDQKKKAWE